MTLEEGSRASQGWRMRPSSLLIVSVVLASLLAACGRSEHAGKDGTKHNIPALPTSAGFVMRPKKIEFGQGGSFLSDLVWTRWSASNAGATGKAHENDCVPSCAQGHYRVYRVAVTLAGVERCPNGSREFTSIRFAPVVPKPSTPIIYLVDAVTSINGRPIC